MFKSFSCALAVSISTLCLAPAMAETYKHAQGETVIEATPAQVMVTDWAAFDNLTSLGIKVSGIPNSNTPPHLAGRLTDDMVKIGSLQEPDVETIAAEEPDLLVIGGRSRNAYPTLSQIVPTLDLSVDSTDVIAGAKANLITLGKIFDKEEKAAELIAALDSKLEAARKAAEGKGTGLVVVINGGKMGIYGPNSRVSWIYSDLGVQSLYKKDEDPGHGGDGISFEYLVKTNPDWLFVIDRDAGVNGGEGTAKTLLDNELIHQTSFWKNDQIIYLNPAASYVTMNGYDALNVLLDDVTAGLNK